MVRIMRSTKIISLTPSGLTYADDEGGPISVDFHECCIGFTKYLQKERGLTEEERRKLEQQTKTVALRNAFAKPMYIEFLCDPPVRFEFKRRLFRNPYTEFNRINSVIQGAGWKTFDLG